MLWQNALTIGIWCAFCGFVGTHSLFMAVVVGPFTLFLALLGHFFDVMDLTGWVMLFAPTSLGLLGGAVGVWWRRTHKPEPEFVPPPPPPGWEEKRQRRLADQAAARRKQGGGKSSP